MKSNRLLMFVALISTLAFASDPVPLKDSRVDVPWPDFKQIIDLLTAPDTAGLKKTVFAPRDFLIASVSVTGTLNDLGAIQIQTNAVVNVFPSENLKHRGWVEVPLGKSGRGAGHAVLNKATMNGKTLTVHNSGEDFVMLISQPGEHALRLDYTCPVMNTEGTTRLVIDLPPSAAGYLDLTAPKKRCEVTVNGVKRSALVTPAGSRIQCPFDNQGELAVDLAPIAGSGEPQAQMAPKIFATTGMMATIKENQLRCRFRIDYQLWRKQLTVFSISLPDSMAVEQVEGAGISDWKVERAARGSVLTVRTNFVPEKEYSLTVDITQKLESASGVLDIPELTARDVDRESGYLAVQAAPTIEVLAHDSIQGLSVVDPQEMPAWMQSQDNALMRFKYSHPPFRLRLDVKRHADMPVLVAVADEAHFQAVFDRRGHALSKFRYLIRNNHKQYLQLSMPPGWQLWSALIDNAAVMPASGRDSTTLLIPLKKLAGSGEGSGFILELVYCRQLKKMGWFGGYDFQMPVLDVTCQQINGEVWAPEKFRYSSFKGAIKKVDSYSSRYLSSYDERAVNYERSKVSQAFLANQQSVVYKHAVTLPVEIDVPREGVRFQFSKSLTVAGEKADVSFSFRKALPAARSAAGIVFWVLALCAGFLGCRFACKSESVKKALVPVCSSLGAVIVLGIAKLAMGAGGPGMAAAFAIGIVAALLAHFAVKSRTRGTAKGAAVIALFLILSAFGSPRAQENEEQPNLGGTKVAIPWSDFKNILDRLKHKQAKDTIELSPPVDYVISQAGFEGKQHGDKEFVFDVSLSVTVLDSKKWVDVPLGSGLAIAPGMTVNKKIAPCGRDEDGGMVMLLKGAGDYDVRYTFTAPLQKSSGRNTLFFPVPRLSAAALTLALDNGGYSVSANGSKLIPHEAGKNRFVYEGGIGTGEEVRITWQREVSQLGSTAAMTIGQVNTFYSVGMGINQVRSEVTLNILHQHLRQFCVKLPAGVEVIDLTGPAVAAWESADSADGRFVTIFFKYDVLGTTAFTLTSEAAYPEGSQELALPAPVLVGVTRQEGFIGVGVVSNVELSPRDHSPNILQKDKRELPPWFDQAGEVLYAYQFLSSPYTVSFTLKQHQNVGALSALVSQAMVKTVMRDDGKSITELEMTVKNRGEQFARLRWKPNYQLWSLFCNDKPSRPAFDSSAGEILVPLEKSTDRTAETKIKLVYLSMNRHYGWLGRQAVEYPSVNMPVQNVTGCVYIPEGIKPFSFGGNMDADHEKRIPSMFSVWFPSLRLPLKQVSVATDFYEKIPQNRAACVTVDKKSMKGSGGKFGGGGDPRARVAQKGTLGIVSGKTVKEAANADIFGKGGFAGNIDATMQGLKAGGSGGVGFGAGYGSGFGGAGEGELEEQELSQTVAPAPSAGVVESGLLSIPVAISFEGAPHSFKTLLLKANEKPRLTFLYRSVPVKTPFIISALLFVLMLVSSIYLTKGLWSGWSRQMVLYGIVTPLAIAFAVTLLSGIPLSLTLLWVVPFLFFAWKSSLEIYRWIRRGIEKRREAEKAFEEMKTKMPNGEKKA
jgi:hypothetical protein